MSYSQKNTISITAKLTNRNREVIRAMYNLLSDAEYNITKSTNKRSDMEISYNSGENVFDGFIGAVERPVGFLANVAPNYFQINDGDNKTWGELLPHKISVDGTKVLVRLCKPVNGMKNWVGISNAKFYHYADSLGINKILTVPEGIALLKSPAYKTD